MTKMRFAKYILLLLVIYCTSCNKKASKPLEVLVIHSYNILTSNSIEEINKGIEQAFDEENIKTNIKYHYLNQDLTELECIESVKSALSSNIKYDLIFCEHDRAALALIKSKLTTSNNTTIIYSGLLFKKFYIKDINWSSTNQFFFYNQTNWEKISHVVDVFRCLNVRILNINSSLDKYISAELYHNYNTSITKFHNITKIEPINLTKLKYIDFVNNNYYKERKFILLDILVDHAPVWSKLISSLKNPGLTFQLSNIGLEERSILGSYTCTPFNQGYEPAKYIALYKKNKINYSREQKLSQQYILNWEIIELINNELFYQKDFVKEFPKDTIYTHRPWIRNNIILSITIILLIIIMINVLLYYIFKTYKKKKKLKLLDNKHIKSKLLLNQKEENYINSFFLSMGVLNDFAFMLDKDMIVTNSNDKTIKNGIHKLSELIELIDPKSYKNIIDKIDGLAPIMALKIKSTNKVYIVNGFTKKVNNNTILILNDISENLKQDKIFNISLIENDFIYWIYNKITNTYLINKEININGKNKNELDIKDIISIISKAELKRIFNELKEILKESNSNYTTKVKLNINNSSTWCELRISLDKKGYNQIEGIYGACLNISNYIKYIQELDFQREELIRSDKLKSAFIANMSHEIRTPLNAIVGFSNILTDTSDMLSEADKKTFSQCITDNSDTLLRLINDIVDISRSDSGILDYNNKHQDLKELIHKLEKITQLIIKDNVNLIIDYDEKDCILNIDIVRLNQVIMNLVTNSIKFTNEGSITIGYKVSENNSVKIYVKDTGLGIKSEDIPHVFERFYKDKHSNGTGIGLSLCKIIVEHYNGSINCESELGKGSTFSITLPTI